MVVADGARADLARQLLDEGKLPQIKQHVVDRGCYRTALTVFPSTTGPAHIPFVCGIHPGTANVPGYRWLCRETHDRKRRSIYRHRSLNSPRGLMVGRDMDRQKSLSLFEYFDKPSSVLELIDYCPNQPLFKIIVRRLLRIVQAHKSDNWSRVDNMVERQIIKRLKAGSKCVIGSFFGIDEYSHLYDPFDKRTIGAYQNIDRAIGNIAGVLRDLEVYDETIIAVVSDHGLSSTKVHIPVVDIVKQHGFDPYYYPRLYCRKRDSAVMESGNSMAALYFKRGDKWGSHWSYDEMAAEPRISRLMATLLNTEGVSFLGARADKDGVVFIGPSGMLRAASTADGWDISVEGVNPLIDHPTGRFTREELMQRTFNDTYPDAVNQLALLCTSPRSGDLAISSEPGYDLRWQHEDPEHHGSHGSLHKEHMHVPLMVSVPIEDEFVYNYDLVPTFLALCGKTPEKPTDGRVLSVKGYDLRGPQTSPSAPSLESAVSNNPGHTGGGVVSNDATDTSPDELCLPDKKKSNLISLLITIAIILMGIIVTAIFKEDILSFGEHLMVTYGETWVDVILFLLTAVSSSPLALPIWAYALVGIALGYNVLRLAAVMAVGSATGSLVTFLLGKYFSKSDWVKKRFPNIHEHPWAHGKSRKYVTWILFLGTASPIPCDVFYVACGAKQYPTWLFWITMVLARFVRYLYLGYGFLYFRDFFDMFL